jgi:uncharacterized protein
MELMTADSYKTFTLITGASEGLGAEFAKISAHEGRNLILVARQGDKLKLLAQDIGQDITIHIITQDLSDRDAAQKIYKKARRLRAEVDQLINNAGFGDFGDFVRLSAARQEQMIEVNIISLVALTRLFLPRMMQRKQGRIMNVSSVSGFTPLPLMSVYAASKSFVLSFSQALIEEVRGSGVSITCLCPGATKTGFSRNAHLPAAHPIAHTRVKPKAVAKFGYQAMLAGTPVAVYGFANKLLVSFVYKLLPRPLLRRLMMAYNSRH